MRFIKEIFVCLLLVISFAGAEEIVKDSFISDLVVKDASIYPGEYATYDLTIYNLLENGARYSVSSLDPDYIITVDPSMGLVVNNDTFEVQIRSATDLPYGPKIFELKVSSLETGETANYNVPINLRNPDETAGQYVPSVRVETDFNRKIDPREELIIPLEIINRNGRLLDKLLVRVESPLFETQFETSINPWKQVNKEPRFKLDPAEEPASYKLKIYVEYEGKVIEEKSITFQIIGYNDVKETSESKYRLLDKVYTITLKNDGNQETVYNVTKQINWFSRLFLSSSDKFSVENLNEERTAIVSKTLTAGEESQVTFIIHWNYLALGILAIVLGFLGYFKWRNPIISLKEILLESSSSKNISEAKIRIFVRNRSNRTLNNVRIIDKLPPIADLMSGERLGTLHPNKITKTKSKGTLIKWELTSLEPYEERIITYKIKSKLEIVGGLTLPPSKIAFEEADGKERAAYSNNAKL